MKKRGVNMDTNPSIMVLLMIVIILITLLYFYFFYLFIVKSSKRDRILIQFYKAIISVYSTSHSLQSRIDELTLNNKKISQRIGNNNYSSLMDILEMIINYYDTFSDKKFKSFFGHEKTSEIRDFICEVRNYLKNDDQFISVPTKEAQLLKNINIALKNNNYDLGKSSLNQLSDEIIYKEEIIKKKERNNQIAMIVSIVGIILTVFFGIMSFVLAA